MIFIACCMPRAGSHLVYNLARVLLRESGADVVGMENLDGVGEQPGFVESCAEPDRWYVVHAHKMEHLQLHFRGDLRGAAGLAKIAHSYRDPRDVLLSLGWFYGKDPVDLMPDLMQAIAYHQEMSALHRGRDVLFLRYEDLFVDVAAGAARIGKLLGLQEGIADLATKAAEECSVDKAARIAEQLRQRLVSSHDLKTAEEMLRSRAKLVYEVHDLKPSEQHAEGLRDAETRLLFHHISPAGGVPGAWREHLDPRTAWYVERMAEGYMETEGYEPQAPNPGQA